MLSNVLASICIQMYWQVYAFKCIGKYMLSNVLASSRAFLFVSILENNIKISKTPLFIHSIFPVLRQRVIQYVCLAFVSCLKNMFVQEFLLKYRNGLDMAYYIHIVGHVYSRPWFRKCCFMHLNNYLFLLNFCFRSETMFSVHSLNFVHFLK